MNNLGFHCHSVSDFEDWISTNDLHRGEFYNFPVEELPRLKRDIISHDLAVSIHSPLIKLEWYPEPHTLSFLCDEERDKRDLTLKMIKDTMERVEDFGAEYVVVHLPSPASSDTLRLSEAKQKDIALWSCDRLAELSQRYKTAIHLEGVGPSPLLTTDFLIEALRQFPVLSYCFDTGHIGLAAKRQEFELFEFAERLAPWVGSVHLWNTRGSDDYLTFRHIAVHPSQNPEQGWVDIAQLLHVLAQTNLDYPIILETTPSYPKALGDYDYRDGVKWIRQLVATLS